MPDQNDANDAQTTATPPAQDATTAQATPPQADNGEQVNKLYATKAEADAAKPTGTKKRLYRVSHKGATRWVWHNAYDSALAQAAKADGYSCSLATAEVSADAVKSALASLSDAELAAMGLTRTPATTPAPTPTPTKPTRTRKN